MSQTTAADLERFGTLYTNRAGVVYLRMTGTIGIRADRLQVVQGAIAKLEREPPWCYLTLEGASEAFAVHQNWVNLHGELHVGETIEGVLDVPEGKAWYLRRVAPEAPP